MKWTLGMAAPYVIGRLPDKSRGLRLFNSPCCMANSGRGSSQWRLIRVARWLPRFRGERFMTDRSGDSASGRDRELLARLTARTPLETAHSPAAIGRLPIMADLQSCRIDQAVALAAILASLPVRGCLL